jgi:hypothetical protein
MEGHSVRCDLKGRRRTLACRSKAAYGISIVMVSPPLTEPPMENLNVGGEARRAECAASVKAYRSAASKYVRPKAAAKASQTEGGSQSSETAVSRVVRMPEVSRVVVVPFGKVAVILWRPTLMSCTEDSWRDGPDIREWS